MRTQYVEDENGAGLMVLLTPEIQAHLKPLTTTVVGADGHIGSGLMPGEDPVVVCKFFHCLTQERLYVTHGRFDEELQDWVLFGFKNEPTKTANWGRMDLKDIEDYRAGGLPYERDKWWDPVPASQVSLNS